MSDLDADLYGDLYGNDESEFTVPMEQPEENGKSDTAESPRKEAPAPAKAEAPPTKVAQTTTSTESSSQPSHASITPTAIPPYTSPPTQQIPTYQDRLTPEYREPPPARQDVGYQPPIDRPVRPSEMKEEG
ncbi:hypothetical protein BKA93DRAFT_733769 [Sparassis latifolia]